MPIATIATGSWQTVVTTAADTVFQNQSPREVYVTTASTGGLDLKEGFLLTPWTGSIVLGTGLTVSAVSHDAPASIYYMSV